MGVRMMVIMAMRQVSREGERGGESVGIGQRHNGVMIPTLFGWFPLTTKSEEEKKKKKKKDEKWHAFGSRRGPLACMFGWRAT
jgi:hypothetical protein